MKGLGGHCGFLHGPCMGSPGLRLHGPEPVLPPTIKLKAATRHGASQRRPFQMCKACVGQGW